MIERLLETWLNKANERSFQIPFCHALASQGHTVVHMSRHCGMELGKDILTIGPDKVPCAYQLKGVDGGRLTLGKWQSEVKSQAHSLVHDKLTHPSLPKHKKHHAFIVVNGDIDEEVAHEIEGLNRKNIDDGLPHRQLETVVKGQILQSFSDLQSDFWATNLREIKSYLELMLVDGKGQLKKKPLGAIFEAALPFNSEGGRRPSKKKMMRAMIGCAIICASAIGNYTNHENHVAEFEAWTLLWAHSLALCERWSLSIKDASEILDLASEAMYTSLANLCVELMGRDELIDRKAFGDDIILKVRVTHLLGLMGIYGLWRRQRVAKGLDAPDEAIDEFLADFCRKHEKLTEMWGEAAVPQLLAWSFYFRTVATTWESDGIYLRLAYEVLMRNHPRSKRPLVSPYFEAEDVLPHVIGISKRMRREELSGNSWVLEALFQLFVRTNLRSEAMRFFPLITRYGFSQFIPDEKWEYYLLAKRNRRGTIYDRHLQPPHSWSAFRKEAEEHEGKDLPELIKLFPIQYLCFLCTVPYRMIPSGVRWVSTALERDAE